VTISTSLLSFVLAYLLVFSVTLALNVRAGWRLAQRRRFTRGWVDDLQSFLPDVEARRLDAAVYDHEYDDPRGVLASR
jgi:hypothetical protein